MRHSKTTALISAASLAVMSILPAAQANAAAPDLSEFTAVPVFEFFNKNDVNGMIGIKLPETKSCLKMSAIHLASFLSVFLPRIALTYFGWARTILQVGSKML